jgi:hypothetical protein
MQRISAVADKRLCRGKALGNRAKKLFSFTQRNLEIVRYLAVNILQSRFSFARKW